MFKNLRPDRRIRPLPRTKRQESSINAGVQSTPVEEGEG